MSNGTWMQTVSGRRVSLVAPDPDTLYIPDIAYSLAGICRFTGHCKPRYYVAEHCIRVAEILPPILRLQGLLHDAAEAYFNDLSRPAKGLLPEYKKLEDAFLEVIYTKWLRFRNDDIVKKADDILVATEGRDLMGNTADWHLSEAPLGKQIRPWSSANAESLYVYIFNEEVQRGNSRIGKI